MHPGSYQVTTVSWGGGLINAQHSVLNVASPQCSVTLVNQCHGRGNCRDIRSMFCHEIETFSGSLVLVPGDQMQREADDNGGMSPVSGLMMPLPRLNNRINPRSIKCSEAGQHFRK